MVNDDILDDFFLLEDLRQPVSAMSMVLLLYPVTVLAIVLAGRCIRLCLPDNQWPLRCCPRP